MNKGRLYLIPTIIGEETQESTLPSAILHAIKEIDIFIVENVRTARRHIRQLDRDKNIDNTTFYSYGKHDVLKLDYDFLPHILAGSDVGLLSEAGLPCIADPGSKIVEYAHDFQIDVVPLIGPSSIFLALMSSGLNGQGFTFNGYLPINKTERIQAIKELERRVTRTGQTQIFMETPYRNNQLIQTLLETCRNNTKLCIASNITLSKEYIKTKLISQWSQENINLHKSPTIFLLG